MSAGIFSRNPVSLAGAVSCENTLTMGVISSVKFSVTTILGSICLFCLYVRINKGAFNILGEYILALLHHPASFQRSVSSKIADSLRLQVHLVVIDRGETRHEYTIHFHHFKNTAFGRVQILPLCER
jgi:hypothetical protein